MIRKGCLDFSLFKAEEHTEKRFNKAVYHHIYGQHLSVDDDNNWVKIGNKIYDNLKFAYIYNSRSLLRKWKCGLVANIDFGDCDRIKLRMCI